MSAPPTAMPTSRFIGLTFLPSTETPSAEFRLPPRSPYDGCDWRCRAEAGRQPITPTKALYLWMGGTMMQADVEPVRIEGSRLADLYARHADGAMRLAYLITGDRHLAEDLVQDAFVKLAGRLLHLRDPGAFEAYLRRTVVNLANSHFRRRKVEQRYVEREGVLPSVHAEGPDVGTRDAARAALLTLPVRQRTAIVLRYYEDLSEAQTAELMGCRPGTVKSLTSRGMDKLRPLMVGA